MNKFTFTVQIDAGRYLVSSQNFATEEEAKKALQDVIDIVYRNGWTLQAGYTHLA
jgi:hypothetical protein